MTVDDREATLWNEVVQHRDSIAPRLVLADYLLERGDPRGEFISLQCTGQANEHTDQLLTANWGRWMGPLTAVLNPMKSRFENGMLEVACVGRTNTEVDYARIRHRELQLVHTVIPAYIWPADYVTLLTCEDLANVRHVHLVGNMLDAFAQARPRWGYRAVTYSDTTFAKAAGGSEIASSLEQLSRLMPDLEELELAYSRFESPILRDVVLGLPERFPRLRRIGTAQLALTEEDRARVQRLPQVIV